ncbi:D-hexose-6-phosphate mutarotase [uncultured Cellulomonas sp.]|uniref:D-hexose-6-phosphate mutarotase n=1 Tax=uncultured Cellulomonas sp. TaxID=189682 RepID=UPI00260C54AC|nr:D-hexose-6-phosphate mutarotase [uncultured Cellulomonas sp.]
MSTLGALPASVRLEPGAGGLPRLVVTGPAASAEIYLHGAQVTRWQPSGHDDVLRLSRQSRFAEGTAIRGGVPICFPWFGALDGHPDAPSHGFARVTPWTVHGAEETGDDVVVTLGLTDSAATRASHWPHAFHATARITVGAQLAVALTVRSTGDRPVTFEEALHAYLGVGDVRRVEVTGLEGVRYVDKLGGPEPVDPVPGPVRLTGPTDRIYLAPSGPTTVDDPVGGRRLRITGQGSGTTVLWNPWAAKAAEMADLGDDEWTGMLCVETSNVGPAAVRLEPGASHTMTATFAVAPR